MRATLLSKHAVTLFPLLFSLLAGCSGPVDRPDLASARQEVVLNAIAQIGTRYRYGGTSPSDGFDCSGLVQYAHLAAGVTVPRMTAEQRKASHRVRPSRARPGDLLFFRTGWGKYHVGILVDEGRFVHAPSGGKTVQITKVDNPYWRKRLTSARTFLN